MDAPRTQAMIPMSAFIAAGGMKTLHEHATHVTMTPVMLDPHNVENYYVDVRFRFNTKGGRPYFGETECGLDAVVTPQKLVSRLSDEPASNEVTVISSGLVETMSEGASAQEPVYMSDARWIARTEALSSILKQEAKEQTEETAEGGHSVGTVGTVTSVRGIVRVVEESVEGVDPDMDREFCFEPVEPLTVISDDPDDGVTAAPCVLQRDQLKETTLTHVPDEEPARPQHDVRFSDKETKKKEREHNAEGVQAASVNARADSDGDMPAGCGLLRSSSLKAAVRTIRRSFSRERSARASEKSDMGSRQTSNAISTNAVEQPRKEHRDDYDDPELLLIQPNDAQPPRRSKNNFDDPELALIQPNPIQPLHKTPSNAEPHERSSTQPDAVQPKQGPPLTRVVPKEVQARPSEVETRPDREVERNETVARGLMRRTSNLARAFIRKLSSNDKRAARRASGKENGGPNETGDPFKRRSWLGRRASGNDIERRPGMVIPECSVESTEEPYRVHKRRSLIFGRRYKN